MRKPREPRPVVDVATALRRLSEMAAREAIWQVEREMEREREMEAKQAEEEAHRDANRGDAHSPALFPTE